MSITLEQAIERKNNNFDLVRLLASLIVIFGHSFSLFPTNGHQEPVRRLLVTDYSGSLAVYVFFFLSGIFITASFQGSKTFFRFILMRIFRIYPALIICVLITVFFVGAIFTTYSLADYFSATETWRYLAGNSFVIHFSPRLPGVFANNWFNEAVDGSLWTLPVELRCYLIILIAGAIGLLKRQWTSLLFFLLFLAFRKNQYVLSFLIGSTEAKFCLFFLTGMLAYSFRRFFLIDYKIGLILVIICVGTYLKYIKLFPALFDITLIYITLVGATSNVMKKLRLPGDYSYGIYIYGFLVQQVLAREFPLLSTYPGALIAMPLTAILGIISWHYIESPAINKCKAFAGYYNEKLSIHRLDARLKRMSA